MQLTLDLGLDQLDQLDRNVSVNDAKLRSKDVARIQRAAILMMSAHPNVIRRDDGVRLLRITYDAAAAWCRQHLECVKGMRLDRSAFRKAVMALVRQGVMATAPGWLAMNVDHLRQWYETLTGKEDEADVQFKAVSPSVSVQFTRVPTETERVQCGPSRVLVSLDCVPPCPPCPAVENLNELNESKESFIQKQICEMPVILEALPDLPDELWSTRKAEDRYLLLDGWWMSHRLAEALGEQRHDVKHVLVGLIEAALKKRNPPGYFAKARRDPADYLGKAGKRWLADVKGMPKVQQAFRARQVEAVQ